MERSQGDYRCSGCGEQVSTGYDSKEQQQIQHLTWWQHVTLLRFKRYRVNCPKCGVRTEALDFVNIRGPRVTRQLASLVFELCKVMTVKAVAIFQVLNRHTVKAIDKQALQQVQDTRLLSRRAHLRGNARKALNQLLSKSKRLLKAYLLKESFNHLWSYKSKTWALKFFKAWTTQLKWSCLKPYQKFAQMVERHLDGILAYCDKKVSLGYIEATNLKARNVIRRAYGYRDNDYMKLKIIQAYTPWMNQFRPWEVTHSLSP